MDDYDYFQADDHLGTSSEWASLDDADDHVRPLPSRVIRGDKSFAGVWVVVDGSTVVSLSGEAVLPSTLKNEQERHVLRSVLTKLERAAEISQGTLVAAHEFLDALPRGAVLPQVMADGEGGLVFSWTTNAGGRTLITVDDWRLHVVLRSGTEHSEYMDGVAFAGDIPAQLVAAISA